MKKHGKSGRAVGHRTANRNSDAKSRPWVKVIIAALIASAVSLVLILLYASCMYMGWLNIYSVPVVNTVIKAIGAALAGFIAAKAAEKLRIVMGSAAGSLYIVLAFLLFSILSKSFTFGTQLLMDLGMGSLAGALAAMLYGALKKK